MLKNYIKIAWKVLSRRKLYTAISLFGISFTLMIVILVSTFYHHLNAYKSPRSRFDRVISLTIVDHYQLKDGSRSDNSTSPPSYHFIEKYLKTLKTPELVSGISFQPEWFDVYKNQKKSRLVLRYTDSELWKIADFKFLNGRPFSEKEFDNAQQVAVIDKSTAELLFDDTDPIGKPIKIYSKTFKICGVIDDVSITRLRLTGNVYVPVTAEPTFLNETITGNFSAMVLAKNKRDFTKINKEFQNTIKKIDVTKYHYTRNKIEATLDKGFYSAIISAFRISKKKIRQILITVVSLIILFYLLLPSINLVNINVNRIYERSSEIGSRKAFGATTQHIVWQFITENIFITILGGFLGYLWAFFIIVLVNKAKFIPATILEIDTKTVFFGVFIIFLLGLLSGVLPARRMSKLQIVNSLKTAGNEK